jgi:hypothetical protein
VYAVVDDQTESVDQLAAQPARLPRTRLRGLPGKTQPKVNSSTMIAAFMSWREHRTTR